MSVTRVLHVLHVRGLGGLTRRFRADLQHSPSDRQEPKCVQEVRAFSFTDTTRADLLAPLTHPLVWSIGVACVLACVSPYFMNNISMEVVLGKSNCHA
jgi:hypothetical protein